MARRRGSQSKKVVVQPAPIPTPKMPFLKALRPHIVPLVGAPAVVLALVQIPFSVRQCSDPTPAQLAGIDRDPLLTLTANRTMCELRSDDGRTITGISLGVRVLGANTVTGESYSTSVLDTQTNPELRFGDRFSLNFSDDRHASLCNKASNGAAIWGNCTGETCFVFAVCEAIFHRQGDGKAYRAQDWLVVHKDGDTCTLDPLSLHRSFHHEYLTDTTTFTWKDPALEKAYHLAETFLPTSRKLEQHSEFAHGASVQPID